MATAELIGRSPPSYLVATGEPERTRQTMNSNGSNYISGEPDGGRNITFERVVHGQSRHGKSFRAIWSAKENWNWSSSGLTSRAPCARRRRSEAGKS
jgi:hypothetical protein